MTHRISAALAAFLLVTPAFAEDPGYLFDALRLKPYRIAWDKLMKDVQPTPDWLLQFNRNYDGDSGAMSPVTVDGKPFAMSFVCKPSDCHGHKFAVLFDGGGEHAFGALGASGEPPAFFGAPTQGEKDELGKAFKE